MGTKLTCVTFDCADPDRVAAFWAEALGWHKDHHCVRPVDDRPYLEFCKVPEGKTVKNRLHLGIEVVDLDAEVARLTELGATFAWEEEFPEAWPLRNIVMRDVEGNEFCIGGPKVVG